MTRLISMILLGSLSYAAVFGQTNSDRAQANLKGTVKTVKEQHYRYVDSKPEERDTVTYDLNGNEIERTMINDYGQLMGKQIQQFDASGVLKETTVTDPTGKIRRKISYEYSAGKLVAISTYDRDGVLREKARRKYNAIGEFSEEIYLDPTIERAKTTYRYEGSRNAVEMAFYLSNGQKAMAPVGPCLGGHRVTFTYDKDDRPLTKTIYDADGNIKKAFTYSWDNKGNIVSYSSKSGLSSAAFSYTYDYDEKGNWIKQTAISASDNGRLQLIDLLMKSSGKAVTEEERKKAEEAIKEVSTRTTITMRQITHY